MPPNGTPTTRSYVQSDAERGDAEEVAEAREPEDVGPAREPVSAQRIARPRTAKPVFSASEADDRAQRHRAAPQDREAFVVLPHRLGARVRAAVAREAEDPGRVAALASGEEEVPHERVDRVRVDELAPALLRLADGDRERLVRRGSARAPRSTIAWSGSTELPPPSCAVDVVERRVRARRPVCVGERLGLEHDDGADRDRDAEHDDQPRQEIRPREPSCERGRPSDEGTAQDRRHLLDARPPRQTVAPLGRQLDVRQPAVAPASVELVERGADRRRRRRARRRPPLRSRGSARPRRRREARPRGSGGRRRCTRTPSPRERPSRGRPASGIKRSSASESRCSASDSARGAYGISSSRSPSPSPSAHSRSVSRKSPRKRVTTSSSESGSAWRNGRGSRRPKKLPVCVSRNRSDGDRSSPTTSSKSHPFGIVTTGPRGSSARVSSEIASETHVIASAREATRRATRRCIDAFALVPTVSARRCACATSESRRSATQRAPVARAIAAAIRCVEGGGEVETTTSMPCCRTSRIPAGIAVTAQVAFSSGTTRRRSWSRACVTARSSPCVPGEHLGRLSAADADVARAVHPRLGRHAKPVVAMQPARVVGREDVRLDAHRGQVLRELQRPLDAAAAGGREVEADDQRLHGRRS